MLVSDERFIARVDPRLLIPIRLWERVFHKQEKITAVRFQPEEGRLDQELEPQLSLAVLIVEKDFGPHEVTGQTETGIEKHQSLALRDGLITEDDKVLISLVANEPTPRVVAVRQFLQARDSKNVDMDRIFMGNFYQLLKQRGYQVVFGTGMTYPLGELNYRNLPCFPVIAEYAKSSWGLENVRVDFLDRDLESDAVLPKLAPGLDFIIETL